MTDEQNDRAQATSERVRTNSTKMNFQSVGIGFSILVGIAGFVQSWTVVPYRLAAAERAITALQARSDVDHESLVRIEEKLRNIDSGVQNVQRILESRKP